MRFATLHLPVSLASPILISCRWPSGYLSGRKLAEEEHQRGVVLAFAISCASGMTLSASLVKSLSGLKILPSDMSSCGSTVRGMEQRQINQGTARWTEESRSGVTGSAEYYRLMG